jgi:anti-sigma factor RsiW
MTKATPVTDEELVAYLDGAIDSARREEIEGALAHDELLAARLTRLDIDTDAIRAAFDERNAMTAAGRLDFWARECALLSHARAVALGWWFKPAAYLAFGIVLGVTLTSVGMSQWSARPQKNWRAAVADYQVLYSAATLASIAHDTTTQRAEIAAVAAKLELPIDLEELQSNGLDFKRAQLLQFNGEPLAQFAYIDPSGDPIAVCVTRSGEADSEIQTAMIDGLAAAFWSKSGYGFIVIGGKRMQMVERVAGDLAAKIRFRAT